MISQIQGSQSLEGSPADGSVQFWNAAPLTLFSGFSSLFGRRIAIVIAILVSSLPVMQAETTVVPRDTANEPGAGGRYPFHTSGVRTLAVYSAAQLSGVMPEGAIVTQIAFRLDESVKSSLSVVVPELEIRMSTSPNLVPDFPPPFFANFIGQDETVVFPRGPLSFSSTPSSSYGGVVRQIRR